MKRAVISPGIACEEINGSESTEEKEAGTDKPSTPEDQSKNTADAGCRILASEEENVVSSTNPQPQYTQDQLTAGRKCIVFQMSLPPVPVSLGGSDSSADRADVRCPLDGSPADVDCLVCFNRYSSSRPPKVLACRHVFCAVCLKLLLRNEDNAWRIACPVCRKVTTVFGGLIRSLPDNLAVGHLGDPGPNTETPFSPDALGGTLVVHRTFSISQGEEGGDRVAAKRLLFLLLLLVILVIFMLPFVYGGLLKWVLCFAAVLALIGAAVLCCSPNWRCRCSNSLPPFR